jgi:hypothetical protein
MSKLKEKMKGLKDIGIAIGILIAGISIILLILNGIEYIIDNFGETIIMGITGISIFAILAFVIRAIILEIVDGFEKNKLDTLLLLFPLSFIGLITFGMLYDWRYDDNILFEHLRNCIKYSVGGVAFISLIYFLVNIGRSIYNYFTKDFDTLKSTIIYSLISLFVLLGILSITLPLTKGEDDDMQFVGLVIIPYFWFSISSCFEIIRKSVDKLDPSKIKETKEKKDE